MLFRLHKSGGQLWRPLAVADRVVNRDIAQFDARLHRAQHESTSAHITPTDELNREKQLLAKNGQQWFNIFRCGDTAQENDFAKISELFAKRAAIAIESGAIPLIRGIDVGGSPPAQLVDRDNRIWGNQARRRRDYE